MYFGGGSVMMRKESVVYDILWILKALFEETRIDRLWRLRVLYR